MQPFPRKQYLESKQFEALDIPEGEFELPVHLDRVLHVQHEITPHGTPRPESQRRKLQYMGERVSERQFQRRLEKNYLDLVKDVRSRKIRKSSPPKIQTTQTQMVLVRQYLTRDIVDSSPKRSSRKTPRRGRQERSARALPPMDVIKYENDPFNRMVYPGLISGDESYSFESFDTSSLEEEENGEVVVVRHHHPRRSRHRRQFEEKKTDTEKSGKGRNKKLKSKGKGTRKGSSRRKRPDEFSSEEREMENIFVEEGKSQTHGNYGNGNVRLSIDEDDEEKRREKSSESYNEGSDRDCDCEQEIVKCNEGESLKRDGSIQSFVSDGENSSNLDPIGETKKSYLEQNKERIELNPISTTEVNKSHSTSDQRKEAMKSGSDQIKRVTESTISPKAEILEVSSDQRKAVAESGRSIKTEEIEVGSDPTKETSKFGRNIKAEEIEVSSDQRKEARKSRRSTKASDIELSSDPTNGSESLLSRGKPVIAPLALPLRDREGYSKKDGHSRDSQSGNHSSESPQKMETRKDSDPRRQKQSQVNREEKAQKRRKYQLAAPTPLIDVEPRSKKLTKVKPAEMADISPGGESPREPQRRFSLYISKKELIKRFTGAKNMIYNATPLTPTRDISPRIAQIEQDVCDDREPLALSGLAAMTHIDQIVSSRDSSRRMSCASSRWGSSRSRPTTTTVRMID